MKALVTGATGLVGSHLCYHLCREGYEVIALYRDERKISNTKKVFSYYTAGKKPFESITWKPLDLLNISEIGDVLKDIEIVFNTAAMVSFDSADAHRIIRYNTEITENLVNSILTASNTIKFIHCSSIAAIGKPAYHRGLIDEAVQWIDSPNNSPYAISKFHSELAVWRAAEEGLYITVVNPGIILGPGFWNDGSGKIFTTYLKGFPFYTDGINGFVDVNDVAKAMITLSANEHCKNERYILVENNYSYKQIFDFICDNLNKRRPYIKVSKSAAALFWRIEWIRGKIFGIKPLITKETATSAVNHVQYSGKKVLNAIDFQYTPMKNTIKNCCEILLKEISTPNN